MVMHALSKMRRFKMMINSLVLVGILMLRSLRTVAIDSKLKKLIYAISKKLSIVKYSINYCIIPFKINIQ